MENNEILKFHIAEKIEELNKIELIFFHSPIIDEGFDEINIVSKKIKTLRKLYLWLYNPIFYLLMAFLLFVAFAQFANYYLFNWDRAGMLIVGMVGLIIQRWRTNRQLERLTMMQFLIELKNGFE